MLIRTLISRFFLLVLMLVYAVPFTIMLCLPKRWLVKSKIFFFMCELFYRWVLLFSFLPIKVIGKENIPYDPVIIAANHQSSLDIPLVGALLNQHPHVWLAKAELMESPILRFVLPRVAVLVDMSTPQKGMRSLIQTINLINGNPIHAVIFPEGGRYTDGNIHDFFSGFVILAKKTGRPVVPVRIFGLDKAYPPHSFLVHYVPITVIVGKPMMMEEGEEDAAFKERVYAWFVAQKED